MNKLAACILAGLFALCIVLPVQAKQVPFTAIGNPDFSRIVTIHVPDGWKHRNAEGTMELTPSRGDGHVCVNVFNLDGRTPQQMATLLANGTTLGESLIRKGAWEWIADLPGTAIKNFLAGSAKDNVYIHFSWSDNFDESVIMAILAKSVMAAAPVLPAHGGESLSKDGSSKDTLPAHRPLNEAEKRIVSAFSVFKTDGTYEAVNVRFSDEIENGSLVFSLDKLGEEGYMHCNTKIDAEKGRIEHAWSRGAGDYGKGVGLANNAWIAEVSAGTESALLTFLKNGKFVGAKRLSAADAATIMEAEHERLFSELLAVISGRAKPLLALDELKNSD